MRCLLDHIGEAVGEVGARYHPLHVSIVVLPNITPVGMVIVPINSSV